MLSWTTIATAWTTSVTRVVPSMPRFGTIEPVSGSGCAANTGHGGGGEHTGERLQRPPHAPAGRLDRERQECERADRREHGPRHEEQARARVAPEHGEPRDGERGVRDGRRLGDVPEREDRYEERDREAEPRRPDRRGGRREREQEHEPRRPERQQRGGEGDGSRRECGRDRAGARAESRPQRAWERPVAWRGRADFDRSRLGEVSAVRRASASCSADGRRAGSIVRAEDTASAIAGGRSGRAVPIGFAPASIAAATCGSGTPQKGCSPTSASQSNTPTAHTSLAAVASPPRSRSGAM